MRKLFIVLAVLAAVPLFAQERDVRLTLFASEVEIEGEQELSGGFETEFESGSGFGLAASTRFNRFLAVEAAIFSLRAESRLLFQGVAPFELGRVDLVPVMVGAQAHLAGDSRFDPYVGAGAAYVMAGDLTSPDLDVVGLGRIEVDNEVTYYLNAGFGIDFTRNFGVGIDGRYIPYEPNTEAATTGGEQEIDLSPRVISFALRFRF